MIPFLTLIYIVLAILNLTVSEEVFDTEFCIGVFNLIVACLTAYEWGNGS